jgi:flagellar assembly factor FliW
MSSVTAPEQTTLTLPRGLVGHPEWQRFGIRMTEEDDGLVMLESLDDPDLYFLATHPRNVLPSYDPEVDEAALQPLSLEPGEDPLLLCLLTVHQEPAVLTANLLGPLAVNPRTGVTVQLVLSNSPYPARHLVCALQGGADEGGEPCSC